MPLRLLVEIFWSNGVQRAVHGERPQYTQIKWAVTESAIDFWDEVIAYLKELELKLEQNLFGERIFNKRFILAPVRVIIRRSINNIFVSAVRIRDGELLEHVSSGLVGLKGNKKITQLCG